MTSIKEQILASQRRFDANPPPPLVPVQSKGDGVGAAVAIGLGAATIATGGGFFAAFFAMAAAVKAWNHRHSAQKHNDHRGTFAGYFNDKAARQNAVAQAERDQLRGIRYPGGECWANGVCIQPRSQWKKLKSGKWKRIHDDVLIDGKWVDQMAHK